MLKCGDRLKTDPDKNLIFDVKNFRNKNLKKNLKTLREFWLKKKKKEDEDRWRFLWQTLIQRICFSLSNKKENTRHFLFIYLTLIDILNTGFNYNRKKLSDFVFLWQTRKLLKNRRQKNKNKNVFIGKITSLKHSKLYELNLNVYLYIKRTISCLS